MNDIGPELRNKVSLSAFKSNIVKLIRPSKRGIFGVHDRKGTRRLFQLRVGLSLLKAHKKRHHFPDTPRSLDASLLLTKESSLWVLLPPTLTAKRYGF